MQIPVFNVDSTYMAYVEALLGLGQSGLVVGSRFVHVVPIQKATSLVDTLTALTEQDAADAVQTALALLLSYASSSAYDATRCDALAVSDAYT